MTEGLRPSSLRKRRHPRGRRAVFLRDGYLGANMDELDDPVRGLQADGVRPLRQQGGPVRGARRVHDARGRQRGRTIWTWPNRRAGRPAAGATEAVRQLTAVLAPRILRFRRLAIAEELRFPELARVLWENGPERAVEAGRVLRAARRPGLAPGARTGVRRHVLQLAGDGAAGQRAMLLGDEVVPDPAATEDAVQPKPSGSSSLPRVTCRPLIPPRRRGGNHAPLAGEARGASRGGISWVDQQIEDLRRWGSAASRRGRSGSAGRAAAC